MPSRRASALPTATEKLKKNTKEVRAQLQELYDSYQEQFGNYKDPKFAPPPDHLLPPTSKFTKTYWDTLDKRCTTLDGKLWIRDREHPLTTPDDEEEREWRDLDAEWYVLGRILEAIRKRIEWLEMHPENSSASN
jgi:hypothetical protein